jgi:hypothetical protein
MMPTRAGKSKRCSVLMAIGLRPSPLAAPMIATMSYAAVEAQNAQAVMVVPLRSRALIPAKCSERIQGEPARSWVAPREPALSPANRHGGQAHSGGA